MEDRQIATMLRLYEETVRQRQLSSTEQEQWTAWLESVADERDGSRGDPLGGWAYRILNEGVAGEDDAPERVESERAVDKPPAKRHEMVQVMPTFFHAIRRGLTVATAAKAAGISTATAYKWRRESPTFAQAWEEAASVGKRDVNRSARWRSFRNAT